ncbi:MAG: NADH-quinone oxidoreductase subunit M [Holosporaceae bacterium]|nr:NADH-quinone oxidoreductase subunit M [Holosporaceae bacterium]
MSAGSILLLVALIPLLGSFHILLMDKKDFSINVKLASVWTAAFAFLLSMILFFLAKESFLFFDISFLINGISTYMIAITTFLILISVIIGCDEIKNNVRQFHVTVLFLESLLVMLFSTADILVFYVLLELVLVIAFMLLGVFAKDSICASKFFIILSIGAIFLFFGVIYLIETTGITEINVLSEYTFTQEQKNFIFAMFFIGFAHQMALFPLHIWLPDSHTKPPISISIILAGILLKIGAFGMITIVLPIIKCINKCMQEYIFIAAIFTIAYATLAAITQRDIKRMVAYVSIIQTATIVIGIFSYNVDGVFGAFFNMIAHSFVVATMLIIIRIIENHFGKRNVEGISVVLPSKMALTPILAIISVPLLPCFVGNFLIISGSFCRHAFLSSGLCFLIACSVLYGLKTYHNMFFGENNQKKSKLTNIECVCLYPAVLCTVIIGVVPDRVLHLVKDELYKICSVELR